MCGWACMSMWAYECDEGEPWHWAVLSIYPVHWLSLAILTRAFSGTAVVHAIAAKCGIRLPIVRSYLLAHHQSPSPILTVAAHLVSPLVPDAYLLRRCVQNRLHLAEGILDVRQL